MPHRNSVLAAVVAALVLVAALALFLPAHPPSTASPHVTAVVLSQFLSTPTAADVAAARVAAYSALEANRPVTDPGLLAASPRYSSDFPYWGAPYDWSRSSAPPFKYVSFDWQGQAGGLDNFGWVDAYQLLPGEAWRASRVYYGF